MPCPVCLEPIGHDHRRCLYQLLKEGTIQTVEEWEILSREKPKTIRKGRKSAVLPKE